MNLIFSPQAKRDYEYWKATDPAKVRRIEQLLQNTLETPFEGIGKPELLRGNFAGVWSRRIDREHRFTYSVSGTGENQTLVILQLRYHYQAS